MNKMKSVVFIALAVFLGGSVFGVEAQKKSLQNKAVRLSVARPQPVLTVAPLPITTLTGIYNVSVDSVELSRGTIDLASGTTYGWTWSGKTDGDLSGFMFVSLNYAAPETPMEVGADTTAGTSKITGGSWSKLIFSNGQYLGSVSGEIHSGDLTWNDKAQNWNVNLQLTSDRGTDAFVGSRGKGSFAGTLDQSRRIPAVSGVLTLEY